MYLKRIERAYVQPKKIVRHLLRTEKGVENSAIDFTVIWNVNRVVFEDVY